MDLRLLYTHSGDSQQGYTLELSLASEIPLGRRFYGIVEVVNTFSFLIDCGHFPLNLKTAKPNMIIADGRMCVLYGSRKSIHAVKGI